MRYSLLLLVVACLASPASAQQARVLDGQDAEDALAAHNSARERFGVAPLAWDATLAEAALRCVRENRGRSFRHCDTAFGENMYGSTRPAESGAAISAWMDEEELYEVPAHRCLDFACGHFTQVVWYETRRVGCAVGPGEAGWNNLICNYDPPGNYGYMANDAGDRTPDGRYFYFDPWPFGTDAPAVPGAIDWEIPWVAEGEAYRSGEVGHGRRSVLHATVSGPGVLTFRWRVSSEHAFDALAFEVDGEGVVDSISGETDWASVSVVLPGGVHRLAWIYQKNEDTSDGADAGWVDQVVFTRR